MNLTEFAAIVRSADGVDAFNETSRLAFEDERPGRVDVQVTDGPTIVAAAFAPPVDSAPVELAVHPAHRRRGHGTALLDRLLAEGESRFWAHGDTPGAQRLAAAADLQAARTLLKMRRDGGQVPTPATDVAVRSFQPDDAAVVLALNAKAFASHPEQGSMSAEDLQRRLHSDWFDPAGLLVAERRGTVVGYHWTKVDGGAGEVYVLAVDPDEAGTGVGTALLERGLLHLADRGVEVVELYVESDNTAALRLYASAGFRESSRDVLFVSRRPATAGPDRS